MYNDEIQQRRNLRGVHPVSPIRPPILIQQTLELCSYVLYAQPDVFQISPGSRGTPALGTGFGGGVDRGKLELALAVQGDHDVDEHVEAGVPGCETGSGVHGYVGHKVRRGEAETVYEHGLVNVPRQLVLFREDIHDESTVIGRGRRFLRCGGGRLLCAQGGVRQAIRVSDLYSP